MLQGICLKYQKLISLSSDMANAEVNYQIIKAWGSVEVVSS